MYTLCDFISITLENTNNLKEQKEDGGKGLQKSLRKLAGDDLDWEDGFMDTYICQNLCCTI